MLIGKNPLKLPPYGDRPPVEYSARCFCGLCYLSFNPQSPDRVGDAEARAREHARHLQARFVNSEPEPFVMCECGQALDFTLMDTGELVM